VVWDAETSGRLELTERAATGVLRLRGPGVEGGRLRVRLTRAGRGTAMGTLGGEPVELAFRFPAPG
jgi:hypothetical protein